MSWGSGLHEGKGRHPLCSPMGARGLQQWLPELRPLAARL